MDNQTETASQEGEGKYDKDSEALAYKYSAAAAMVLILGGTKGAGFSISTILPDFNEKVPQILRNLADMIDGEIAKDQKGGIKNDEQ